nr:hypothetical protein PanWU01x14_173380 [Ipomoea batatas]
MVRPEAAGGAGGGRKDPERDKISKRPCKVTTAPGEAGWRRVTFVTVPVPLIMQTPRWRRRAKAETLSMISHPSAISITWVRSALALSRVMIIGGFGLFFDPAGRPLGLLVISPSPDPPPPIPNPSFDSALSLLPSSLSRRLFPTAPPLFPSSSVLNIIGYADGSPDLQSLELSYGESLSGLGRWMGSSSSSLSLYL